MGEEQMGQVLLVTEGMGIKQFSTLRTAGIVPFECRFPLLILQAIPDSTTKWTFASTLRCPP
jgi:hypothetical protein